MEGTRRGVVRGMMAAGGLTALAGGMVTAARAQAGRKTFVLVHGSSAGGWCYRRVADLLEKAGHKVYAPTLTGLGERSHLMSGLITLDTHIADIVNVIRWEDLEDFVLVGHSYGGWIISGVAERMEGKISSIVFLDAFMPENGQRVLDTNSSRSSAEIEHATERAEVSRPAPPASVWKVNERGSALGQREVYGSADRRRLHPYSADRCARSRAKKDLRPGQGLRQSQFRNVLRQGQIRSFLAHLRNAVRP